MSYRLLATLIAFSCIASLYASTCNSGDGPYSGSLAADCDLTVEYNVDCDASTVQFKLIPSASLTGWMAIGINEKGTSNKMKDTDVYIGSSTNEAVLDMRTSYIFSF